MAFIVEDGTIVPDANSYTTVAYFRAYWLDRGVTFIEPDTDIEAALVVVTQYTDGEYMDFYKGDIVDVTQSLCWPRVGATDGKDRPIDSDVIPLELQNAISEYAKRQVENPEGIQPDVPDTGEVIRQKDKADVIETETQYAEGSGGYFGLRRYPMGDNWLKGLIEGRPGGLSTVLGCAF